MVNLRRRASTTVGSVSPGQGLGHVRKLIEHEPGGASAQCSAVVSASVPMTRFPT